MKFAKVGERLIALEPTNFGAKYQALFNQTNVSMAEQFAAYSHNNFQNPFAEANQALYDIMGWWAVISRDRIVDSRALKDNKIEVVYVSHAGLSNEKTHKVAAPINGWYVPTADGIFIPETGVPFETVEKREKAVARLEKAGLPAEQVSYFYRNNSYAGEGNDRFVGRDFDPGLGDGGRFSVDASRLPSGSGYDGVASFPAYRIPEIVFEVPILEKAKA